MGVRLPLAVGLMVMAVVALSTTVGVAGDDSGKAAVAAVKDGGIAPLSYGGFCQRPASAKLASSASLTAGSDTETATATTPAGTGVLQLAAAKSCMAECEQAYDACFKVCNALDMMCLIECKAVKDKCDRKCS